MNWAWLHTWRPVVNVWDIGFLLFLRDYTSWSWWVIVIICIIWTYISKSIQDHLGWRTRLEQERA